MESGSNHARGGFQLLTMQCFNAFYFQICLHVLFDNLFVCVEVLRPSQPNRVMSSVVSLPIYMFTGQALSSKRLTSIVHIPSPETNNCPS